MVMTSRVIGEMNPFDNLHTPDELELREKERQYKTFFEQRLRNAQENRDRVWPEFSNKTFLQYNEENEKIANTIVDETKNEGEPKVASGTIEAKLNTLLSHIDNLNLSPEVMAWDADDNLIRQVSTAFTDIMTVTAENDGGDDGGDTEKRLLRQKELLKQGTVFVQERWTKRKQTKKKLENGYNGEFRGVKWSERLSKVFEGPERELLYAPNVYLGDITKFSMNDQPFAFMVETMHYDKAKEIYGEWENWVHVKKGNPPNTPSSADAGGVIGGRTIFDGKFRLRTLQDDQVEIIRYQDPTRDEFQIMINGIMMMPIGFPLSAVTPGGRFNLTKQILYPINAQFAYGKAFVSSGDVYELSKIIDEMLRLFILKTRKSITPPYINNSGKVISRLSLMPGNISSGIVPGALQPIGNESQGVTAGEYQIYQELIQRVEQSTVSPIFQGQFGKAGTTATEVLEVQRQARLALGIIISACTMLEVKCGYLRLWNLMANWFSPIGEYENGGVFKKRYRKTSREVDLNGKGRGTRKIIPTDEALPHPELIAYIEKMDEKETGRPTQRIYLSPKQLMEQEMRFRVVVNPQERMSSAYEKLLFRETLADALALVNLGARPNVSGLMGEFAKIYRVDQNTFFADTSEAIPSPVQAQAEGLSGKTASSPAAGTSANAPAYTQQIQAGIA